MLAQHYRHRLFAAGVGRTNIVSCDKFFTCLFLLFTESRQIIHQLPHALRVVAVELENRLPESNLAKQLPRSGDVGIRHVRFADNGDMSFTGSNIQ